MRKISKEEFIRKFRKLEEKADVEAPTLKSDDYKFDEFLRALIVEEKNVLPLSEETVEILHEILRPMKISKSLSKRLLATMLRADKDRQVEKQVQKSFAEGLFGSYIAALRERQNLSIPEVASRLQIDSKLLEGMETNRIGPPELGVQKLLQLATILKSPLGDFIQVVKKTVRISIISIEKEPTLTGSALARVRTEDLKNKERELLLKATKTMLEVYKRKMEKFLNELEKEAAV